MKTSNFLSLILIAAIWQQNSFAQTKNEIRPALDESSYRTAIGLRGGQTSGLTIKHFFNDENAFEGIIGFWPYAFGLTGLYEKHEMAFNLDGMRWYYGAGGHATLGTGKTYYAYYDNERRFYKYSSGMLAVGVDGILGLEYKIRPIPFAVSLDMKPFVEINNEGALFLSMDPSVGIKVTF